MELIPLTQLEADPQNVRKVVDADGITELAASIQAHGLMQNLVVRRKPKTKTKFLVAAGGRRLAALQQLVGAGVIERDYAVPCQVLEDANATEASLAENVSRCEMAPIDQFEAFAKLRDDGMAIADIATRFGITESLIERRMRLGDLAPELREAMRAGDLSLDTAMAFARRPDPALQVAVWKGLGGRPGERFNASVYTIRRDLDEGGVPSDGRIAKFVGVEAYVAAGGGYDRDLFDTDGGGVLTDPDLLNKLAEAKLKAEADAVVADGWAWVEVAPELAWDATQSMGRIYPKEIEDPELDAEYTELTEQLEALEEVSFERELKEDEEETFETLERRMGEIEAARRSEYAPEDKTGAGVFVSINHDGSVRREFGFVRKEDMKAKKAAATGANGQGTDGTDETAGQGAKPYSQALLTDLAEARNEVFQAHLAQAPEAAFDLLVFSMATSLLVAGYADTGQTLSTGHDYIPVGDGASDAAIAFLGSRDVLDLSWCEAEDTGTRFTAFCALPFEAREAIMAWCVAAMAMPRLSTRDPNHPIEQTGQRIGIDTRSLWRPSTETLFARLSKGQILAVLAECGGQAFADRHSGMKKGDLVDITDRFFAGDAKHHSPETGVKADAWLPDGMAFKPVALMDDANPTEDASEDEFEALAENEAGDADREIEPDDVKVPEGDPDEIKTEACAA
ncbi:MAG: ParB/RepB/Spo0J family partition protein [Pseudomonadota bacterium]